MILQRGAATDAQNNKENQLKPSKIVQLVLDTTQIHELFIESFKTKFFGKG